MYVGADSIATLARADHSAHETQQAVKYIDLLFYKIQVIP